MHFCQADLIVILHILNSSEAIYFGCVMSMKNMMTMCRKITLKKDLRIIHQNMVKVLLKLSLIHI